MIKKSILIWYLLICLQTLFVAITYYFDLHKEIWDMDETKLSFAIFGIWFISSIFIGYWHLLNDKKRLEDMCAIGWYLAETCLALGMVGTVAGFLLMLGVAFGNIDVSNIQTLQNALTNMASGMSTALYTTLVGLIASLFLKSQLVNLEHYKNGLK